MQTAEKISITMTPEMMRVIRESVEAREYASTSEAMRDAVRVWQRERTEHKERLASIKARIRRSLDDPRPDLSSEEVEERIAKLHAEAMKAHGVRGSGNIFADLGDADAEAKKMKAVIAAEIIATLNERQLSAREGAKIAKVDAADIQRIRNGDLSRFTIDRLVRVAYRLGRKIEMHVTPVGIGVAA